MKNRLWQPFLVLIPFLLIVVLFQLAPLAWIIINSFINDDGAWSLTNYMQVLSSPFYQQAFEHSFVISTISALAGLIIATIACASMRHIPGRWRNGMIAFTNMTSNFAGVPLAFAFIIVLGFNGAITLILRKWGWIGHFNLYDTQGLSIVYTYFQIPLAMLLLYPAFDALKDDWQEAASLLGAPKHYYWRRIALPVLSPALLGTFVILLANGLGTYATAYTLTAGNYNLVTVRIASLVAGDLFLEPNLAAAISMVLMILLIFITIVNQWLVKRSYHVS